MRPRKPSRFFLGLLRRAGSVIFFLALVQQLRAAPLQQAKVTRIIKDVQLLPSEAAARPAAVNDDAGGRLFRPDMLAHKL